MVLNEASATLPIRLEQLNYPGALRQINLGLYKLTKWDFGDKASCLLRWITQEKLFDLFLIVSMTVKQH